MQPVHAEKPLVISPHRAGRESRAHRQRTQGANDFIMFSTMAVSSFSSGAMVSTTGWEAMNWTALPVLAAVSGAVVWYARRRPRPKASA